MTAQNQLGRPGFPTILPVIENEEDFKSFRRILRPDFAYTFNEWLDLIAQWRIEYGKDGGTIREMKVKPDKFSRFLDATEQPHTLNTLLIFAERVANGDAH